MPNSFASNRWLCAVTVRPLWSMSWTGTFQQPRLSEASASAPYPFSQISWAQSDPEPVFSSLLQSSTNTSRSSSRNRVKWAAWVRSSSRSNKRTEQICFLQIHRKNSFLVFYVDIFLILLNLWAPNEYVCMNVDARIGCEAVNSLHEWWDPKLFLDVWPTTHLNCKILREFYPLVPLISSFGLDLMNLMFVIVVWINVRELLPVLFNLV